MLPVRIVQRVPICVFAYTYVGIDNHGLGKLKANASVHQGVALPLAKDAIDVRQVCTGIAAEDFAGICGDLREHGIALRRKDCNGIGEVQLAVFVVGLHLCQGRPELFEAKTIDAGINFVDFALLFGELGVFDNGLHARFGFAHDPPVAARIADDGCKDGGRSAARPMRSHQSTQGVRADKGRVAWQYDGDLGFAQRAASDLHRVPGAMLRILQHRLRTQRFDYHGDLFRLMAHDCDGFPRAERSAGEQNVLDQRAAARAVQDLGEAGFQPRALSRGENDYGKIIGRHGSDSFCGSRHDLATW
jgi:hypothetical protein